MEQEEFEEPRIRIRPKSVCPRCDGFMQRKTAIMEKYGRRHFGDSDPFLNVGGSDIQTYICVRCGMVNSVQETIGAFYFDDDF